MNKQKARIVATTTWFKLAKRYPTNMVELAQFEYYFEIRFFGNAGEDNVKKVINKIPDVSPKDVRLHTNVLDNEGNWCLHIELNFEIEE